MRPGRYDDEGREREFVVVCHRLKARDAPERLFVGMVYCKKGESAPLTTGQLFPSTYPRRGDWLLTTSDIDAYVFSFKNGESDAFERAKLATRGAVVKRALYAAQFRVAIHVVLKRDRTVRFWERYLGPEVWPCPSDPIGTLAALDGSPPGQP